MAIPAYQSAGAGDAGTITSGAAWDPACPATVTAGEILIAHVSCRDTTTTPSTPNGWTLLRGPDSTGTGRHWLFGKIADGTEDGTAVSFGTQAVTVNRSGRIYSFSGNDYSGQDITQVVLGFDHGSGSTSTVTDTGVTTATSNCLALNFVVVNDNNTIAAFTGMTGGTWAEAVAEVNNNLGTGWMAQLQTANMASAGTINGGSVAMSAADPWGVIGCYIREPIPPKQTSTAEVSLASASTPETRTLHAIKARARKTANQGILRVRLYEGASTRSAELSSSELTTSLAEYTFNIADADAETITSYSNLSVRFYGYSATGTATVFEVAEIYLQIPEAGLASVSKDLTASYNVIGNVTKALSASYNVIQQITKTLSASYVVNIELAKAVTASYNIIQQITKTVTASYGIAGLVQKAVTANFNVQVIVSQAVTASYNVLAQVSKAVTANYGIAGLVTKELTASYNVIQQITKTVTASYTIATELAKALSASYNIVGSVVKTVTANYNIVGQTQTAHARVSLAPCDTPTVDTGHSFNIRARITNAAHTGAIRMQLWEGANPITGVYQPTALTTTMSTYNMEITEGQAATIVDYDNLEVEFWGISTTGTPTVFEVAEFWLQIPLGIASVSKTLTASYNVVASVSKTLSASYNVAEASPTKSLTANYSLGGVVQKSLTATPKVHRFGPRGLHNLLVSEDTAGVQKSLTASYGIAGTLQKSLSASYNVQVSVSKALTANYNVKVELAKALTANYNVIVQVSKTLTASYNVTTAVSKTLTASYNVPGAIQKALSASYNVRVELSKSLTANYNVLSTASVLKSLTASYNVAAQLQKALSASYFVTTSVSKTLSPSYNVIAQVQKILTANYNIVSFTAVSKNLSASYNVKTLVGQSLTTFYTLQGGVSKTLTGNYNVRVILTKNLSASYTVNGGVAKTLTANYNVIAQVQKSVTAIYALGFVVVKPLSASYTVREQITKTLSPNYIVIGQITKELIPTYVTKVILTKDLIANYWKEDPLTPPPPYEPVGSVNLEGSPQGVNLTTASKPRGRIVRVP